MAARANAVVDQAEAEKALRMLALKYPQQNSLPLPMPTPVERVPRLIQTADDQRPCPVKGAGDM